MGTRSRAEGLQCFTRHPADHMCLVVTSHTLLRAQAALSSIDSVEGLAVFMRSVEAGESLSEDELAFGPTPAYRCTLRDEC